MQDNKEEWLKERKTYIGGSDLGAILGINNFRTELDVYFEKRGGKALWPHYLKKLPLTA